MPLHEFECEDCGGFIELPDMEKRNDAACCPACDGPASRLVSAPFLAVMQPLHRQAAVRNERSQHEPRVGLRSSCCASNQCSHRKPARKPGEKPARQASTKKNRRPWMLGHKGPLGTQGRGKSGLSRRAGAVHICGVNLVIRPRNV